MSAHLCKLVGDKWGANVLIYLKGREAWHAMPVPIAKMPNYRATAVIGMALSWHWQSEKSACTREVFAINESDVKLTYEAVFYEACVKCSEKYPRCHLKWARGQRESRSRGNDQYRAAITEWRHNPLWRAKSAHDSENLGATSVGGNNCDSALRT